MTLIQIYNEYMPKVLFNTLVNENNGKRKAGSKSL